jgi:cytoskeletal protein CcmA (bactofilin family)
MFFEKKNEVSSRIFGETDRPQSAVISKSGSIIEKGVFFKGDLVAQGSLHFEGELEGDLRVSNLILGKDSKIRGSVTSLTVEVFGNVEGTIDANEVILGETAVVKGDITHQNLIIERNARFEGLSRRLASELGSVVKDGEQTNKAEKTAYTQWSKDDNRKSSKVAASGSAASAIVNRGDIQDLGDKTPDK